MPSTAHVFLALYEGETIGTARMIAATSNRSVINLVASTIVNEFATAAQPHRAARRKPHRRTSPPENQTDAEHAA